MTSNRNEFHRLQAAARQLGDKAGKLTPAQLRELLCHDCDFWHEGHEEELECSCFRMLRILLEQGILTPARLAEAVTGGRQSEEGSESGDPQPNADQHGTGPPRMGE